MSFIAAEDTVSATDERVRCLKPFPDNSVNSYLHFDHASSSTRYEKGSGRDGLGNRAR